MPNINIYDEYGNKIDKLTQWDLNRTIRIKDFPYNVSPIFHFCNIGDNKSLPVESSIDDVTKEVSVSIPNELLQKCGILLAFIYLYDSETDTGATMYKVELPVQPKPKPNDYIYTSNVDYITITELKSKLQTTIDEANSVKEQIEESLNNGDFNGVTFIPKMSEDGTLTWENNGSLPNPTPMNIKGEKGDSYTITESDIQEIADIVKTQYLDELETMIDESEVLV